MAESSHLQETTGFVPVVMEEGGHNETLSSPNFEYTNDLTPIIDTIDLDRPNSGVAGSSMVYIRMSVLRLHTKSCGN